MHLLDLTLPTPEANLAYDEALLDDCEERQGEEILRFWEFPEPFVVLGIASRQEREVNVPACAARRIPVLRRCSGGGTVVQGPGCLSYALILRIAGDTALQRIDSTNTFIMRRHARLLADATGLPIRHQGTTDLAVGEYKFSGNAQRRRRRFLLFHGTFLLDFPIPLMDDVLLNPPRMPLYRRERPHRKFVTNLRQPAARIKALLARFWNATPESTRIPTDVVTSLVEQKYSARSWNERC